MRDPYDRGSNWLIGHQAAALLKIGGAMVMVHGEVPHLASRAPEPDGNSPVVIFLYLEDVDRVVPLMALQNIPLKFGQHLLHLRIVGINRG